MHYLYRYVCILNVFYICIWTIVCNKECIINGEKSDTDSIKYSVPKGFILGPLLFILSVNDICNVSPLLFKILIADDTCVLLSGNNLNTLIALMNTELISLNIWFKANKLSLNTKNHFFLMIFHRSSINSNSIAV